jgi:hypothetical protein
VIFEPGKTFDIDISSTNPDTLVKSLYQCFEPHSLEIFWLLSPPLVRCHLRFSNALERISRPSCDTLYSTNTSHRKKEVFLYEYIFHLIPLATETHNRTLLFGTIVFKHGRHFDYRNQPLNMSMRVCYPDCHEGGLYCYLLIHIENLLHPLQLFYFHLWPIYWLSLTNKKRQVKEQSD